MTRTANDRFAKQHLEELLKPLGEVEVIRDVAGETREIDVWFTPYAEAQPSLAVLGLLGRLLAQSCAIEPFRNPIQSEDVRNCLSKLLDLIAELRCKTKREKLKLADATLPRLWILTPTISERVRSGFAATTRSNWSEGIYFLPDQLFTALVAIHELPATPETLWLRLMGRGRVQAQAIAELLALPTQHPLKPKVLEHLAVLQITLQSRQNLSRDERELAMNLSPAYQQWREATLEEGRQEGWQIGRRDGEIQLVCRLLNRQVGELSDEVRSGACHHFRENNPLR